MGSPWRLREGKGSRRLHEPFVKTSRALKASISLRKGFAKASRRLQPYPRRLLGGFAKASAIPTEASWRLREGFAKAPRAPPFGIDSSDNDKPPIINWSATNPAVVTKIEEVTPKQIGDGHGRKKKKESRHKEAGVEVACRGHHRQEGIQEGKNQGIKNETNQGNHI